MKIQFKNKKIEIDAKVCNWFEKLFGLMFHHQKNARALLFNFQKPSKIKIHSWFVFFPFVAICLDDENNVLGFKIVKPFRFSVYCKENFSKILEIPINQKYKKIIKFFVGN